MRGRQDALVSPEASTPGVRRRRRRRRRDRDRRPARTVGQERRRDARGLIDLRGRTAAPADAAEAGPRPHRTRLRPPRSADSSRRSRSSSATAVARDHPERAWPIVDPRLREGLTKREWATGNIPVVPYPAVGVDLIRLQSLVGSTALVEIILDPKANSHLVRKTFEIELHRQPRPPHLWAVSSWVPEGVSQSADRPEQALVTEGDRGGGASAPPLRGVDLGPAGRAARGRDPRARLSFHPRRSARPPYRATVRMSSRPRGYLHPGRGSGY